MNTWGAIGYDYKSLLVFIDSSSKKGVFTQKDYLAQVLFLYIESILMDFGPTYIPLA
jgi:hypothetical protein